MVLSQRLMFSILVISSPLLVIYLLFSGSDSVQSRQSPSPLPASPSSPLDSSQPDANSIKTTSLKDSLLPEASTALKEVERSSSTTTPVPSLHTTKKTVPKPTLPPTINPGCMSRRLSQFKPIDSGIVYHHPPVVQYAKLSRSTQPVSLTFMDYIALMSAYKFVKPERIILLTYTDVNGKYWELIQKWKNVTVEVKKVDHIYSLGGKPVGYIQHQADFIKLTSLLKLGGIISDLDVIVINGTKLKDMQRISECVLSQEGGLLNSGFSSCVKNSSFIREWLGTYHTNYHPELWVKNSAGCPTDILRRNDTCYNMRVVDGIATQPTYDHSRDWMKEGGVNWRAKVAAHYFDHGMKRFGESVAKENHSFGELLRYVLDS